ncbi:MAG: hypothetical protein JNK40_00500 [Chromatiales bacterium]|nr:hypothetical protein [Chromatiales bacterium]
MRAILICLPLLAACSPTPGPPAPQAESRAGSRAEAADDNVIGAPLEQSLDKARSVEELSGQRKGGLDEAIDGAN